MTFIWYFVALGGAGLMTFFLYRFAPEAVDFLHRTVLDHPPPPALGVLSSISGAVMTTIFVLLTQNRRIAHFVLRYRWAEERLVELRKMQIDEILRYHTEYNWDVYAGMSVSALLIVVSVIYTAPKNPMNNYDQSPVIFLSLLFLAISAALLAIVDMFHTNTLSPLITIQKRFQLVDLILKVGSIAIVLQICAISSFVAVINPWLSIFVSAAALWFVVFFAVRRGIPLAALKLERNLSDGELEEVRLA